MDGNESQDTNQIPQHLGQAIYLEVMEDLKLFFAHHRVNISFEQIHQNFIVACLSPDKADAQNLKVWQILKTSQCI